MSMEGLEVKSQIARLGEALNASATDERTLAMLACFEAIERWISKFETDIDDAGRYPLR